MNLKLPRCINLDWLEVYALEPITTPHDAEYFIAQGFEVIERGYGTRIYEQMFTLIGADSYPFMEIRRFPKNNSVLPLNATHLRLINRYCYFDNAGDLMRQFIERYSYTYVSVSRVDICMDFERFDSGDYPDKFVKRYIAHKYAKINQSNASAHFEDTWDKRDFNSLSWGQKTSDISTKLYDKTMELYDEKLGAFKKPYILHAWFAAQLVDDPVKCLKKGADGKLYRPRIWRLEFSIKSNTKGWFTYKKDGDGKEKRSIKNNLQTYANRKLLLPVFDLLQQHYFHFKKFKHGRSKYSCEDKILFDFSSNEIFYSVEKPASADKPDSLILRLRKYLTAYQQHTIDTNVYEACSKILQAIERREGARMNYNAFSAQEYDILQRTIALRLSGDNRSPDLIANELLNLMKSHAIF